MNDKAIIKSNYDQLVELLNGNDVKARFDQALGKRSGAFIASVMTVVAGNPALKECVPTSIMAGAIKAAVLDLPLLPDLGYACLVPFSNNKTGNKEAQFQIMTNGLKQLALRSKQYEKLNTTRVYEGQEIIEDQLTGDVRLNGKRVSDKVIGWVNYFRLHSGYEKYFYMTIEEIHAHGRRYSKSYDNPKGLWKTDPEFMEAKTVTKLNLKRNGILSVSMMDDEDSEFVQRDDYISSEEQLISHENPPLEDNPVIEEAEFTMKDAEPETIDIQPPSLVEPAAKPRKAKEVDPRIAALVEAQIVPNEAEAVRVLALLNIKNTVPIEEVVKIVRGFNGWKGIGATDKQAKEALDEGKYPK